MIYGAICFECFNRVDVVGDNFVEKALVKHTKTDEVIEIPLKAIFGYIGTEPKTDLFKPFIQVGEDGYIKADESMQTNVKGVYVAGDVRQKEFRQIATAVADGTIAALKAEKYITENKENAK